MESLIKIFLIAAISISIVLVLFILILGFVILSIKVEDVIKKKERNKIVKCLKESLDQYCRLNSIRVVFEAFDDQHSSASAYISYKIENDMISNAIIHLRKGDIHIYEYLAWSTYAHEIGHFISINAYNDNSEQGADKEAYELIKSILPKSDQKYIETELAVCFGVRMDEYEHPQVDTDNLHGGWKAADSFNRVQVRRYYVDIRKYSD